MIERISKAATAASVLLIVVLLLWLHPDITPPLQGLGAAAFAAAWLAGRWRRDAVLAACVLAGPIAPALLRAATGREQPVLDVVWMSALAGVLLRGMPWPHWALPPIWRPLAGGWALVLALSWPVITAREIAFNPDGLRDWGAVVSWAYWPAPHAVSWTLYWVLAQLLGLLWLERVRVQFVEWGERIPSSARALAIGTTVGSVVAIVQGTIDLDFLNPPFWAARGRATGMMLEANGFGHAAALAGPVAFLILRARRPDAPAWAWSALLVNWLGLWMSGSRLGALLCGAAGAAGLAAAVWRSDDWAAARRHLWKAAALVAVTGAVLVLFADAAGPLRRLAQIDREGILDLWDRGGYGSVAVQIVREYPFTGTGPGTFHYLAPDYWRAIADDALAPDNAQNWWRHQAAELGLLGGAFVLIWSAVLAWHVVARSPVVAAPISDSGSRIPSSGSWFAGPVVRSLLFGIGLSSLLGVPTQNPVVLLWFFLLAGWLTVLGGQSEQDRPAAVARWLQAAWPAGALLAITFAAGHVLFANGSLSVADRANRFEREYIAGAHQPEPIPEGGEYRWTDDHSRFVLPAATPWLVLRLWASHPDVEMAPVDVTISSPCGVRWHGTLATADPVNIGIRVEPAVQAVDATVEVSRTWRPSAYGSHDARELGVAVSTSFRQSPDAAERAAYTVPWTRCPEGDE